jgi:hypothetical protein
MGFWKDLYGWDDKEDIDPDAVKQSEREDFIPDLDDQQARGGYEPGGLEQFDPAEDKSDKARREAWEKYQAAVKKGKPEEDEDSDFEFSKKNIFSPENDEDKPPPSSPVEAREEAFSNFERSQRREQAFDDFEETLPEDGPAPSLYEQQADRGGSVPPSPYEEAKSNYDQGYERYVGAQESTQPDTAAPPAPVPDNPSTIDERLHQEAQRGRDDAQISGFQNELARRAELGPAPSAEELQARYDAEMGQVPVDPYSAENIAQADTFEPDEVMNRQAEMQGKIGTMQDGVFGIEDKVRARELGGKNVAKLQHGLGVIPDGLINQDGETQRAAEKEQRAANNYQRNVITLTQKWRAAGATPAHAKRQAEVEAGNMAMQEKEAEAIADARKLAYEMNANWYEDRSTHQAQTAYEMEQRRYRRDLVFDELRARDDAFLDRLAQGMDPNREWNSKSAFGKVATIIAIGISGGIASSSGTGINTAMRGHNKAIDRDIAAQKTELDAALKGSGAVHARWDKELGYAKFQEAQIETERAIRWDTIAQQYKAYAERNIVPLQDKATALKASAAASEKAMNSRYARAKIFSEQRKNDAMTAKNMAHAAKLRSEIKGPKGPGSDKPLQSWSGNPQTSNPRGIAPGAVLHELKGSKIEYLGHKDAVAAYVKRSPHRREAAVEINQLRVLMARGRHNKLFDNTRWQSEASAKIDQIMGSLLDVGRKMVGAGAQFSKEEMKILTDSLALNKKGFVTGASYAESRLNWTLRRLKRLQRTSTSGAGIMLTGHGPKAKPERVNERVYDNLFARRNLEDISTKKANKNTLNSIRVVLNGGDTNFQSGQDWVSKGGVGKGGFKGTPADAIKALQQLDSLIHYRKPISLKAQSGSIKNLAKAARDIAMRDINNEDIIDELYPSILSTIDHASSAIGTEDKKDEQKTAQESRPGFGLAH